MNVTKRQKRRIRNLVCIQYSIVKMLLVIAGFELLGRGLSLMQGTQSATQEIEGEVIWSEETKTEENPLIVCVDAGHGGKDNGSDYKGRYEKDDNLKLAQAVSAYLADKNVKVVMTRFCACQSGVRLPIRAVRIICCRCTAMTARVTA